MISDKAGQYLVKLAKDTIKYYLDNGKIMVKPTDYPIELDEELGVFVTLNKNHNLRGCIGYAEPIKPAIDATMEVALAAAFNDPRFHNYQIRNLMIWNLNTSQLSSIQLSALIPAFMHVCSKKSSFVNAFSTAT